MGARIRNIPGHTRKKPEKAHRKHAHNVAASNSRELQELRRELEVAQEGCHHWRCRYFCRHEEAQRLEGQLSLRDQRILGLEKELSNRDMRLAELTCDKSKVQRAQHDELALWQANENCELWRLRYFRAKDEAQKLQGQVEIKNAEIEELKAEVAKLRGHNQELKRIAFGKKTEKGPLPEASESAGGPAELAVGKEKRKRGRQRGAVGKGRNRYEELPVLEEREHDVLDLTCPECGETLDVEMASEDSYEVEVEVRAYRRKHRRKKYGHFCKAKQRWVTKTAPAPAKIWPKSGYGIGFWIFVLVGRFLLHIALHRLCLQLKTMNLPVSQGTITSGFKRIAKLIKPLIQEIRRYSREEKHHWHIDDTGWKVFVLVGDKTSYGWYLWVFLSDDVCVYVLSPSRGRDVPKAHLEASCGVVTSDRLASNMKLGDNIDNSFCWVHIRREFRKIAAAHPETAAICNAFLELIGSLFHLNSQRLLSDAGSPSYTKHENQLRICVESIRQMVKSHLEVPALHEELRRVLKGMDKDWEGLKLFLDLPSIPPENNPAERALRGPVVGRKNCYGSGARWSGEFMADMYSLIATLESNKVNVEQFLKEYFTACAQNGGKPPPNAKSFLPWNRRHDGQNTVPPE